MHEARSNWIWGGIFFAILLAGIVLTPWLFLLLLVFPVQGFRLAFIPMWCTRHRTFKEKLLFGMNCYFAKLPQVVGQLRYVWNRITQREQRLIEYK